ncbi:hypothetical protein [Azospirillum soli]|uniref:hypothetical protein n=1 Tax=Azospirillum soli TaxID=1304799 RepID=UPI001AE49391|nr:hypothetical protein [Azospirillum soli]MBP2311910.1 hypothetical protein [Azospirillum soli]
MTEFAGKRLFTDEEVMHACDISMDSLRKLITWKAAVPAQAGGGRSRVRLWKSSQIARICVASRIANSGFSLRMAHTMAYALPLDDMLSLYDLDLLDKISESAEERNKFIGIDFFSPEELLIFPHESRIGHVLIVNNKYVYTDALGSIATMWGVIDWEANRLVVRKRLEQFYWGKVANNLDAHPRRTGVDDIDPSSLLVTVLGESGADEEGKAYWAKLWDGPDLVPYAIYGVNNYGFSTLVINLYIGLQVMLRRLLGLPYRIAECQTEFEEAEQSDMGVEPDYSI